MNISYKKKNGGFTLVELAVSMGIAIAVIALTCTILLSSFQFFGKENDTTQGKMLGETMMAHIESNLRYATALTIADGEENLPATSNTYAMTFQEGQLYEWKTAAPADKTNFYSDQYYQGMQVKVYSKVTEKSDATVTVGGETKKQNQWLTLRLEVNDRRGELLYRTEKTFELVNLSANIESSVAGTAFAEKNLRILGNAATTTETENPVFCYDVQKVNYREDYNAAPVEMYNQVMEFVSLPNDEMMAEYKKVTGSSWFSNDGLRKYIRLTYYDGAWPALSDYVDVAKYGISYNGKNTLSGVAKKDLRLTFHYDTATKSCIMYGVTYNNKVDLSNWIAEFIYVPENVDTFSGGAWYTYYPTLDTITDSSNPAFDSKKLNNRYDGAPQLTQTPRYGGGVHFTGGVKDAVPTTLDEYYDIIRDSWNIMKTSA